MQKVRVAFCLMFVMIAGEDESATSLVAAANHVMSPVQTEPASQLGVDLPSADLISDVGPSLNWHLPLSLSSRPGSSFNATLQEVLDLTRRINSSAVQLGVDRHDTSHRRRRRPQVRQAAYTLCPN